MERPGIRDVGSAFAGYAVMFAVALPLGAVTLSALGTEGAFQPGTWAMTGAWMTASTGLGIVVSATGGFTAYKLSVAKGGVAVLMGMVVAVGLAGLVFGRPDGGVRMDDVSLLDAMTYMQQPGWLAAINPLFSMLGVGMGARVGSIVDARR